MHGWSRDPWVEGLIYQGRVNFGSSMPFPRELGSKHLNLVAH